MALKITIPMMLPGHSDDQNPDEMEPPNARRGIGGERCKRADDANRPSRPIIFPTYVNATLTRTVLVHAGSITSQLSDPGYGTRGLQPRRFRRVRSSAWLGIRLDSAKFRKGFTRAARQDRQ